MKMSNWAWLRRPSSVTDGQQKMATGRVRAPILICKPEIGTVVGFAGSVATSKMAAYGLIQQLTARHKQ